MVQTIYKVQNITKVFGNHVVLNDISLEIKAGEIFGLIGASGSGKTTLLNILIGFLRPEIGNVLFKEEHLLEFKENDAFVSVNKRPREVKNVVGFAAQLPSFYPELSPVENLEYFGSLYGLSKNALRQNKATLLNLMGLEDFAKIPSKHLSGGMERRLDIACSLIHDPKVLILDEPTADLDPVLRNHIWKLIKKINKKGTTIILASHHLTEIETLCDRIAIIKGGKALDVGTTEEIKNKFSKDEVIVLESFPGNYKSIVKKDMPDISKIEDRGTQLVIYTPKPEKVLHKVLHRIEELNENLIDVKVTKPSLDDIFIALSGEKEEDSSKEDTN